MQEIIRTNKLVKSFGKDDENILKGIDLKVKKGEFVAVMGQSGCGKSTLLYNVSGMDRATSGDVFFENENIMDYSDEKMSNTRLKKMGFIFQHSYLLKNMSIEDNILTPGYKATVKSKEEVKKRASELMKKMNIEQIADHDISQVSGGQLQRAAICRALINQPEIIFADEPTGALNSSSTLAVMDILNDINSQGTAILLVTHDAKVAARADRIIFLSDGKIDAECELGKYEKNPEIQAKRQAKTNEFLAVNGF